MPEFIELIFSDLSAQFLSPRKRLFVGYLACAFGIAVLWICVAKRTSLKTSLAMVFAPAVWLSRSSLFDFLCFLINRVLFTFLRPVFLTQITVATLVYQLLHLQVLLPIGALAHVDYWIAASVFTLFYFIFDDFSRFGVHYLMHRIPILWEFHKFHHSAETLTPLTVTRTHPVEGMIFILRTAIVQGVTIAIFVCLFGNKVDLLTIYGVGVFSLMFHSLGSNLRHSHVALHYPEAIERIFISPAQHQLHHSNDPRHFDRNFGVVLAVWDHLVGSFHPSTHEKISFGLGPVDAGYTKSVWSMYWLPFASLFRRLAVLTSRTPKIFERQR